jgi:YVTN family beta-propeller protein
VAHDVDGCDSSADDNSAELIRADGMTFSPDQGKLFVAEENADVVGVIETNNYTVERTIDTRTPNGILAGNDGKHLGEDGDHHGDRHNGIPHYSGAFPIAVTLSPDGKTLYAVNNGSNSIAQSVKIPCRSVQHSFSENLKGSMSISFQIKEICCIDGDLPKHKLSGCAASICHKNVPRSECSMAISFPDKGSVASETTC